MKLLFLFSILFLISACSYSQTNTKLSADTIDSSPGIFLQADAGPIFSANNFPERASYIYFGTLGIYLNKERDVSLYFDAGASFKYKDGAFFGAGLEVDVFSSEPYNKKTYTYPKHKISLNGGVFLAGLGLLFNAGTKYQYRFTNILAAVSTVKVFFNGGLAPYISLGLQLN
jgi:hypothetical protein